MIQIWEKLKKMRIDERKFSLILIGIYILQIFPLLLISKYNMPSVDDFSNGAATLKIWTDSHSVILVFKEAIQQAKNIFFDWQGTFSGAFLAALQPAIFGEQFYCIVPFVMLGIMTAGTFLFVRELFGKVFGASCFQTTIIALVWLSLSIQLLPSAVQGFYWYTGAVIYTFLYSMALFLYAIAIKYLSGQYSKKKNILYVVSMSVLGFIIGGGNYVTALLTAILFVLTILCLMWQKNRKWLWLCIPFSFFGIAFVLSVMAPGNFARLSDASLQRPGILGAIWQAVCYSLERANAWINIPVIISMAILMPVLVNIALKSVFSFKHPLGVTIITYGLYAAQFYPHAYTMGTKGPDRLQNIIFFYFFFFLIFNLFYWLGAINRKMLQMQNEKCISDSMQYSIIYLCCSFFLVILSCWAIKTEFPSSSMAATYSLITGEASAYGEENEKRLVQLKDGNQREVVLDCYVNKPCVLYWDDVAEDKTDWRNEAMASFYGKDSIVVK